ncbi:hypothetical protein [Sinomonas gamaensis]|uniref:hypothetical protein n=1 Tax=Sinomonas gamaensis TaxID=2565624 RepID=UPI001107B717|nr:hypothetical protein [Sinomonas gamaensis]
MGDHLRSGEELDRKATLKRLSVALAVRGVFAGVGLLEGEAGFGDFAASPSAGELQEHRYSVHVEAVITKLEQANGPYQIQACFTLSRALALVADPESAIVEFYKLIELYIKHLAWTGALDPGAAKNVLVDKIIFSKRVKDSLRVHKVLDEETLDLAYRMKEVRNKFIGHGGMRPPLGELFGDPEGYGQLLEGSAFKYDADLKFGSDFFERVRNDVMLMATFLFTKMQGIEPYVCVTSERLAHSSKRVIDVLTRAGRSGSNPIQTSSPLS